MLRRCQSKFVAKIFYSQAPTWTVGLGADGPRNSGLDALTIADPAKGSRLAVKLRKSEARLQVNA